MVGYVAGGWLRRSAGAPRVATGLTPHGAGPLGASQAHRLRTATQEGGPPWRSPKLLLPAIIQPG